MQNDDRNNERDRDGDCKKPPSVDAGAPDWKSGKARTTPRRGPRPEQRNQNQFSQSQPVPLPLQPPTNASRRGHDRTSAATVVSSSSNTSSSSSDKKLREQHKRFGRLQNSDALHSAPSVRTPDVRLDGALRENASSSSLSSPTSAPVSSNGNNGSLLGTPLPSTTARTSGSGSKQRSQPDEDLPGAYRIPGIQSCPDSQNDDYTVTTGSNTVVSSLTSGTPYSSIGASQYSTGYNTRDSSTQHTGLTQASPVVTDVEEGDLQKIREEAEAIVQNKLAATIAVAKVNEEHDADAKAKQAESDRLRKRRRCILTVLLAGLVLGAVGTVVSVVVSGRDENRTALSQVETPKPTSKAPTIAPTPLPILDGDPNLIDTCFGAFDLSNDLFDHQQLGRPLVLNGTTNDASPDEFLSPCGIIDSNGRGVWYRMSGNSIAASASSSSPAQSNNHRWLASTCHDLTQYDSQLSVYRGTCQEGSSPILQCVAGNDQTGTGCGDSSRVAFVVEPTDEYYLYVHGFRNSGGLFQLSIEQLPDNDQCEDAIIIEQPPKDDVVAVFGSTQGATIDNSDNLPATCGSTTISSPGVWYAIEGTGDIQTVVLEAEDITGFSGQMTAYRGDSCSQLACVAGTNSGTIGIFSAPGEITYILVHGSGNQQGDFSLVVRSSNIQRNEGQLSVCDDADEVGVGTSVRDNLLNYQTMMPRACGNGVFVNGPGVWYKVTGTGAVLRASTCNELTANTDTRISVFEGDDCDNLVCIGGNDDNDDIDCSLAAGRSSSYRWPTKVDSTYYVLVHGISNRANVFELSIDEVEVNSADTCVDAPKVSQDGSSIVGTLFNATSEDSATIPECPGFQEWPGVWYSVQGTGKPISASTCDEQSDLQISLVVYIGDCASLRCVETSVTPCGQQSLVTWQSTLDETYFLLVQSPDDGDNDESQDRRELIEIEGELVQMLPPIRNSTYTPSISKYFTMTVEPVVFNDQCDNPIGPVPVEGSLTYGSTRSATVDAINSCSIEPSRAAGRGVWYTAIGNGKRLTVTTSTGFTVFATTVSVFTGSCSDHMCLPSFESSTDEKGRSSVIWDSVDGELYSILVSGSDIDEFGEFAIRIGVENDICAASQSITPGETAPSLSDVDDYATADQMLPKCHPVVDTSYVWYTVEPIQQVTEMVAIVDYPERESATRLTVYEGSCTSLACVEVGLVETGRHGTSVKWEAREATRYFVLVHGPVIGPYELTLVLDGQSCRSATHIHQSYGIAPVQPSVYSLSNISECDVLDTVQGRWFHITGTGFSVTVDLECLNEASVEAYRVSVLEGDCRDGLTCVKTVTTEWCYKQGVTTFETVIGMDYYVVVNPLSPVGSDRGVFVRFSKNNNTYCDVSQVLDGVVEDGYITDGNTSFFSFAQSSFCGTAFNIVGTGADSGAWFKFQGTGSLLSAATCYDSTTFDSQITVYRGKSCNSLECVTGSNDLAVSDFIDGIEGSFTSFVDSEYASYSDVCASVVDRLPRTSSVSWASKSDETYYLLVHGVQGNYGEFTLTVQEEPVEGNTRCEDAIDLTEALSISQDGRVYGSTRFALPDDRLACMPNADAVVVGRAVWYRFKGTGGSIALSTCSRSVDFRAVVDVFLGSCDGLKCPSAQRNQYCDDGAFGTAVLVSTDAGVEYFARISSNAADDFGDFQLQFIDGNDDCVASTLFRFDSDRTYMVGTTVGATIDEPASCDVEKLERPGVWYSVFGRGETLVASSCHLDTEVPTSIYVYTGSCEVRGCVEVERSVPPGCDKGQSASWFGEWGQMYRILVVGDDAPGRFGLSMDSVRFFAESESCQTAKRLTGDGERVSAALAEYPVWDASACGYADTVVGAWYVITGTDAWVEVFGFCEESATTISVFRGDCESKQTCVTRNTDSPDFCFEVMGVRWLAEEGVDYYILVHSPSTSYAGVYSVGVNVFKNDVCWNAYGPYELRVGGPSVRVEGRIDADSNSRTSDGNCGDAVNNGFGLWYTVTGNGSFVTASTCNGETDMDTQISVYAGSNCFVMDCVAGNDNMPFRDANGNAVGNRCVASNEISSLLSEVRWFAEAGVTYRIFVHGNVEGGNFAFGSFVMTISSFDAT